MTDTNDLFSPVSDGDNPAGNEPQNYLAELVGEGKKFKDYEALAKGKWDSDTHIKQLERESRETREQMNKIAEELRSRKRLEEILDRLSHATPPQSPSNTPTQNGGERDTKPVIDKNEIENLMNAKLTEHEIRKKREENTRFVQTELRKKYGNRFPEVLREQTQRLNVSEDYVRGLAADAPQALLKLIEEPSAPITQVTPPKTEINTSFKPSMSGKKTYGYYEQLLTKKLQKDDPVKYKALQKERHDAAQADPETFFSDAPE